ncbi:Dipeptide transport system permease protein DppC [Thalassovita autumnalis]|jgi:peptide/nickel transport system permease protein|uniref:Dipeptide transport system permease protein DppC n=1 Tax=Thalassovita autumnalis TaxID=2072972 RepID=A0A0N7LWV4_9RHOB|nr:ABC transporter permease [Thalassovita autumnalis]CUH70146.1 Dipeptide transport system permease protein DppC [Thalassovita autumnalis]CUH73219.1 Dipeptide transport system permease protein DppC [Thalassovita autumnalis]
MTSVLKTFLRNRKAAIGLAIVIAYVIVAIAAPLIAHYEPLARVGRPHQAPSADHWLGTTRMGRDVFSQLIYGTRNSLMVGVLAGFIVTAIGTTIGITAAYFGGLIDDVLNFLTNVVLVLPQLPLLLVLAAFLGQVSPLAIALIIGLTSWAWGARVTRAQALSLKTRDYIQAAEMIGEPSWRMILVEMLPNLLSIIGFNFIGSVIFTIITQATLEFLGLGSPLTLSWGTMLYNAQNASAIIVGAWWEVLAPCAAIVLIGVGLSLMNFGVDEIANPRMRSLGQVAKALRLERRLSRQRMQEAK